jgi:hypothetical protein
MMLAKVVVSMGRYHLMVGGFDLATEGDQCRAESLPEDVLPPIPEEELARASIGGRPAKEMPIDIVRFFRGACWTEKMLRYVADEINRQAASPDPAPTRTAKEK